VVRSGGIIAYATEAVFGLGCDPRNSAAVQRLLAVKGRSVSKGLILIAADISQLWPFIAELPGERAAQILASWPGPVTWVLPACPGIPNWLTGGRTTLAVRVTAHPGASALCHSLGSALISTSANRSARPPARNALQVMRRLGASIHYILPGGCGPLQCPTRIIDAVSGVLLRA
jgi:L-threonylcarbamoyladenylate synthase